MAYSSKGKALMAFAGGKAIALATSHTLTISPQITEDRTKDDAVGPAGTFDYAEWTITSDSVVGASNVTAEQTYETLLALQLAGTQIGLKFDSVDPTLAEGAVPAAGWVAKSTAATYPFMSGNALIQSVSINAGSEGNATLSVTFQGIGTIS